MLAEAMRPYEDPRAFAADSAAFRQLREGYDGDMGLARALKPLRQRSGALALMLPDAAWARRAIGVLANELMHAHAGSAIAILSPRTSGGFTVSLRVPEAAAVGADEFCRRYPTGGGRRGAAGINDLPPAKIDHFLADFEGAFGG